MRTLRQDYRLLKSLLRVPTYLLMILYLSVGLLVGMYVTGTTRVDLGLSVQFLVAGIVIAAWYIHGTALNDYVDVEIDKINLKGDADRPIVSGQATRQEVLRAAYISMAVAVVLAAILAPVLAGIVGALIALNIAYSFPPLQISRRGGLAPLLLPLGYIVLPFSLGYFMQTTELSNTWLRLVLAFYLHFIGRIILKDYRDVKGDKAHGKMTFLLRHGSKTVTAVSALAITTSAFVIIDTLGSMMGDLTYMFLVLISFGLGCLWQLSQAANWKQQKPILSAFGRSMTGTTALIIITFISSLYAVKPLLVVVSGLAVMTIYLRSALQAYSYNVQRLDGKV